MRKPAQCSRTRGSTAATRRSAIRITRATTSDRKSTVPWMIGIVAVLDRAQHQPAKPGNREHLLQDDRSAHQERGPQADGGDYRDERALERVHEDYRRLGKPLGPRGAHVVFAQHLEDAGARVAQDDRGDAQAQRERGPEHARHALPGVLDEGHVAERRDLGEPDRAEDHDEGAGEEARGGDAEQGEHAGEEVEPGSALDRAQHPQGHAEPDRDRHRHQAELKGDRTARQDLVDDRAAVDEGVAEVALQEDAPEPPDVLLQQRAVEPELGEDEGAGLRVVGDGDPHHPGDDVARNDADEQEGEEGDPQHHRDQQQQAPDDVPTHTGYPPEPEPPSSGCAAKGSAAKVCRPRPGGRFGRRERTGSPAGKSRDAGPSRRSAPNLPLHGHAVSVERVDSGE